MRPQYCVICGKLLPEGSRSDRLTCGNTCRKRLSRARHRPPRVCAEALNAIYGLAVEAHLGLFPGDAFREIEFIREYTAGVHADITMHQPPRKWWED